MSQGKNIIFLEPHYILATSQKKLWSKTGHFNYFFPQNIVPLYNFFPKKNLCPISNGPFFWLPSGEVSPQKNHRAIQSRFAPSFIEQFHCHLLILVTKQECQKEESFMLKKLEMINKNICSKDAKTYSYSIEVHYIKMVYFHQITRWLPSGWCILALMTPTQDGAHCIWSPIQTLCYLVRIIQKLECGRFIISHTRGKQ